MSLQETIVRAGTSSLADLRTTHSSRRRKKLATFMGTLLEEMTRAETTKAPSTTGNTSVLGNISPHDETGSESPPSYNQLNYNDNLTRFFNSQPKTLTEKEASAIESSFVDQQEKHEKIKVVCDSSSDSRHVQSGSPLFDNSNSNTASNSESGNSKHKPAMEGSGGDSNEYGNSGGTGTGTSGGVSAAANAHHKRIHSHTYRGSGGSGNNSGASGDGNGTGNDLFKSPLLTEQLLLAHNRGMEKQMIESYKEGKRGDLRFLKNRLRSAKAAYQQAMKRTHHHHTPWNEVQHRVHKPTFGQHHVPAASNVDPQASTIQLWPPFSVANTTIPIPVKPTTSVAGGTQPVTSMSSSHQHYQPHMRSQAEQAHQAAAQPVYSNLIPALFFPAQMATNQRPTGGYLAVSMPTNFIQQPLQLIQPIQGTSMIYQPGEAHNLGSNYAASSQRNTSENRSGMIGGNHMPGMSSHGNVHNFPDLKSPEQQNSMSSSSMEGPSRVRGHEKNSTIDRGPNKKAFNFQRPSSRTGSRATSVKAEPGSALESNIESNASVSASVRAVKLASPGGEGFLASSSRTSGGLHEQAIESTDSSMCSLLKSSDDFTPTTSNGSDDDEKEYAPNRPSLPDPFWLANVNYSNQLVLSYQMKPKTMVEILKRDRDALKTMTQPNQVREQLAQLYRELEDTGEAIRPLLEADGSTASCTSTTSSSSNGDENDEILKRNQKQKQVRIFKNIL